MHSNMPTYLHKYINVFMHEYVNVYECFHLVCIIKIVYTSLVHGRLIGTTCIFVGLYCLYTRKKK